MAKKEKYQLDSMDFDRSLDMPDFDFSMEMPKDDGKPVTKIGRAVGRGFLGALRSSTFIRNTLSNALPRGYGSAIDFADQSASAVKDLYDTTARDLKPQLNELKRVTGRFLPKEKSQDGLVMKRLRSFAESYEKPDSTGRVDPREQNIAAVMGEVFAGNRAADIAKEKRQDIKDEFKEGLAQARHKDVLGQLDAIRRAVSQTAAYTTTINANYQRKSLELQYRHYFLAMDMLVETKRANAEQKAYMEGILRNTALSDSAKLTGQKDKSWLRNKFTGALNPFDRRGQFANMLRDSMVKQAKDAITRASGAFRQGLGTADMFLDNRDMLASMGIDLDAKELIGEGIGSEIGHSAGRWVGNKLRPHLEKNQTLRKYGNKAQYAVENMPTILQEWAKSEKGNSGLLGLFTRFMKSSINGMPEADRKLERDSIQTLQQPAVFDRSVAKSITDVIPGYLARILRELRVQNTGDDKEEIVEYDLVRNKFSSRSEHRKAIKESLFPEQARKYTKDDLDRTLKEIGADKLPREQREILARRLLADNVRGLGGSKHRLMNKETWLRGDTLQHADAYTNLFKKYYAGDDDDNKHYEFSSRFNSLGRYAPDQRALVQHLVNNGQTEYLQELGLIDEKGGNINFEKIYEMFGDGAGSWDDPAPAKKKRAPRKPKTAFATGGLVRGAGTGTSDSINAKLSNDEFVMKADVVRKPGMLELLEILNEGSQATGKHFAKGGRVTSGNKKTKTLAEVIQEHSIKREAVTIIDLLDKIYGRLERGVATASMTQAQWTLANQDNGYRTLGGHAKYYADQLWDKGRDLVGKYVKFNKWIWNKGGEFGAWGAQKAKDLWDQHGDTIKGKVTEWKDKVKSGFTRLQEVWIEGELRPRLLDYKLKTGQYVDLATGKIITSWKDIQGDIAELGAKDTIVLYAYELEAAFIRTRFGKKMITMLGAGTRRLKDKLIDAALAAKSFGEAAQNVGMKTVNTLLGVSDGPADVYVKNNMRQPVLLKILMEGQQYYDKDTKKPIKKPTDIKGPVVDAKGLFAGGYNILQTVKDKALQAWDSVGDFFRGWASKDGIIISGSKKIQSRLDDIYDLLLERLPGKKVRVGSVEDLRAKRREKEREADRKKEREEGAKKGGWLGGIGGVLGKLFGRNKKDKDEQEDSSGGLADAAVEGATQAAAEGIFGKAGKWGKGVLKKIPGVRNLPWLKGGAAAAEGLAGAGAAATGAAATGAAASGAAAAGTAATAAAAKRGWLSRLIPKSGLGKGLGAGLLLGGASSLANATGHDTIGSGLGMASNAVTGWTGATALAGLLGIEGGALGLLGATAGTLLSGIAAIASSPIALPAALAAGAAYGGYKLFKYATRNSMTDLQRARYAQYGFLPSDDSRAGQVFGLESQLKDAIAFGSDGIAGIQSKKVDWKKVLENFGVDLKDKKTVDAWTRWFAVRFKPVFLTAVSAMKQVKPDGDISSDGKLTTEEKKKFFQIARYPGGPYGEFTSPFADLPQLPAGPSEVKSICDEVAAGLDKKEDSQGKGITETGGGAALLVRGAKPKGNTAPGDGKPSASSTTVTDPKQLAGAVKAAGISGAVLGGTAAGVTIAGSALAGGAALGRVDAITAIRYKTYGLKDLEADKVGALARLETVVAKYIKFDGNKVASFTGDPKDIVNQVGAAFGVSGPSAQYASWNDWFMLRFMPTYLNFRTALAGATGKEDVSAVLKPKDAVNVAMAITTASSRGPNGTQAVWQIPASPWKDYELNAEVSSTEGNMKGLKDAAKSETVREDGAFVRKTSAANDGKDQKASDGPSIWSRLKDGAKSLWNKGMEGAIGGAVYGAQAVSNGLRATGDAITGGSRWLSDKIGSAAGQAWDTISNSKVGQVVTAAAGKVKDTLLSALKEAGIVDPTEVAMFMAQMDHESGGFKALSENLNYRASQLRKVFGKYFGSEQDAANAAAQGPEAIANRVYGGRMGNTEPGDGFKYRGRGVIQLTGKANYAAAGQALGIDLLNNPDLASNPSVAAKIAIWYWRSRPGLADAAKRGDVVTATKAINGGQNGLEDRRAKFAAYLGQAKTGQLAPSGNPGGESVTVPGAKPAADTKPTGTGAPASASMGDAGLAGDTIRANTPAGDAPTDTGATPSFEKPATAPAAYAPGAAKPTPQATPVVPVADAMPGGYLGSINGSGGTGAAAQAARTQTIVAQRQAQQQAQDSVLKGVPDILSKQLDVQSKILDALIQGFAALKEQAAAAPASSAQSATPPTVRKPPSNMPTGPVSVSRKQFA